MKNDTQTHAANPADNETAQHTTAQHTPGPWQSYLGNYRNCVGTASLPSKLIAIVYAGIDDAPANCEEEQANAELIASAPRLKRERDELLDLLLEALPYVKEGEEFNKPTRRTLSKRVLARLEKGGAS